MKKILMALQVASACALGLVMENSRPLQAQSEMADLEAWETPITGFFIRNHHEVPIVDAANWEIIIDGLVEKPLKLSVKELRRQPQRSLHAVLECSGNGRAFHSPSAAGIQWKKGAVGNAQWTGVSLGELLKRAKLKPEAKFIRIEGADKPAMPAVPPFFRSIPISKALEPDTLLATEMNRQPMPLLHGGPVRLVLPRWYGQNWIKWVTKITVMDQEDPGFYMKNGYRMPKTALKPGEAWDSTTGNPVQELRVQTLIVRPQPGAIVAAGEVDILGKAFSGSGIIKRVEISIDHGTTWNEAEVEAPHSSGGWQSFKYTAKASRPGHYTVLSRATDSVGNVQPADLEWNPSGYLRNDYDRVAFEARDPQWIESSMLVQEKCLACHSSEMIRMQKLTEAGWTKVVTKMKKFGAVVSDEEIAKLAAFFSTDPWKDLPAAVARVDFDRETARFKPSVDKGVSVAKGKKVYQASCAACHGGSGEGGQGPRLFGRAIPQEDFLAAVKNGQGTMPAFDLGKQDLAAIRSYLQRPARN